jgi:HSP20 family molecular chaperone IbpA
LNDNKLFLIPKFENFYDIIIDIQSIKDINIGWEIKMNKNGEKILNEYKNKESLIIGIVGHSNKGKTFLLSKIAKTLLPTEISIKTEGLSIKYLELGFNKNIILLDAAGLETPVLIEKENLIDNEDNKLNQLIKEKATDKLMTETFLQNFIISNSDILITVVGNLTFSEQKLLKKIKEESIKTNKILFIIHNLITFSLIDQVQQYIKNYLLKAATFDLEERTTISINNNEKNIPYYYEKNNKIKIFHLIFAKEGSEAGNYYNEFALNFIEKSYLLITSIKPFDIIQKVKERFIELSKNLIEKDENNLWIKEDDFINNELILKEKKIKLNNQKNIVLKRCYIDELGFSNLSNHGFIPNYNYFEKNNKLMIRIEAPGNIEYIKTEIKYSDKFTIIEIKGKKKKDKEPADLGDNIFNSREYGEFIINIPIIKNIINKKGNITNKNGIIMIEYDLGKENKVFEFNGEDEI